MRSYGNTRIQFGPPITNTVKTLIIINVVLFAFDLLSGHLLTRYFALYPYSFFQKFPVYQLFTYGFLHGGFLHILFNMLGLWILGSYLEKSWGRSRFLRFYFISIIGGGVFGLLETGMIAGIEIPVLGASGGVMGLLLGMAMMWPDMEFLLFMVFPMKLKHIFLLTASFDLLFALFSPNSGVAHFAHLGGIAFGFVYLYTIILKNSSTLQNSSWFNNMEEYKRKRRLKKKQKQIDRRILMKNTVDHLLEKISKEGMSSLTKTEKDFLNKASKELKLDD